jgi:hypothetical protein
VIDMAEIKDKIVTVESLSALHEHDTKTYLPKANPVVSGDFKISNGSLSMNRTTASLIGENSTTLGANNRAIGTNSCAEGTGTIATGWSEHVQGVYNISSGNKDNYNYLHIIGNGQSGDARSNAHTVDWDGNAWYSGNVYVGGNSQSDATKLVKSTNVVSIEYGDTLPAAGNVGRIFLKKLSG